MTNLSETVYWQGDLDASRRYAEQGLRVAVDGGFADQPQSVSTRIHLLRALREQRAWADGAPVLAELLRVNDAVFGGSADAARAQLAAAQWSAAKGDDQAALDSAIEARKTCETHLDPDAPELGRAFDAEASALIALGRLDEADAILTRATSIAAAKKSTDPLLSMRVDFSRARLLEANGQRGDAEATAADVALAADEKDPEQAKARDEIVAWMKDHDMTPPKAGARTPTRTKGVAAPLPISPG